MQDVRTAFGASTRSSLRLLSVCLIVFAVSGCLTGANRVGSTPEPTPTTVPTATATPTPEPPSTPEATQTTSTQFDGFTPAVVLVAMLLATLVAARASRR